MTQSFWQDFKLNTNTSKLKNYDYVIVGGGIAGLSTAYWLLQKDSNLKIGIVEKNQIAFGASGRNAGFVTCGSTEHFIKLKDQFGLEKAVEIWKFSEDNRKLLQEHIIQDNADKVDFKITGSCTVAANSERWGYYKEIAKTMRAQNIDVYEVNASDMDRDYGVTGFEGGIVYAGDGYIHPVKLLGEILKKLNVYIHENTEVQSVSKSGDVFVIKTDQETLHAAQVVITVNAYLPLVNPQFSQLIVPGRGQILLTKPLPQFVKGPCYLTKHLCYFRQLPTGELLIGGFRNLSAETEKTHTDETTAIIQNALYDFVKNHFRLGAQAEIARQWSGIMGYSPDGQMIIGSLFVDPGLHYLAGCSGHGMGLSFKAAQTLVNGIYGAEIPHYLHAKRFKV
ncbi:FAD-dependent oxidoreductase [Bdellovibrio sp. qaytius]|nr:FAD-dependent oxidoreductase [Bdellovibrio sp. qaytius]